MYTEYNNNHVAELNEFVVGGQSEGEMETESGKLAQPPAINWRFVFHPIHDIVFH